MLTLRILIVDDEKNQREMISGFLQKHGYKVKTAESGEAALKMLESNAFEVGLFDMKMSGISGLELLQKTLENDPEMQIIMITAFGSVETAVTALNSGAFNYLCKPVNLEELLSLIKQAGEKHYLLSENKILREKLAEMESGDIIGKSQPIKEMLSEIVRVAATDSNVLISGESGTGKELIASSIHKLSPRAENRFVAVNCAAIPETLLESELLGHEKGAFTGAEKRKLGKFELASGGTIFLDEIGELPLRLQVKILRVLEERRFERLGGEEEISVDIRILAATNRDLPNEVEAGRFREDLFYRLNVVNIKAPALRDRRSDILLLVDHFILQLGKRLNRKIKGITPAAKDLLISYNWPGNVRELANAIERAIVMSRSETLDVDDFSQIARSRTAQPSEISEAKTLRELEKKHIEKVLLEQDYNLNKSAELLGIHRNTLRQKMKDYSINKR